MPPFFSVWSGGIHVRNHLIYSGNRSFDPEIEKQLEEEFLSIQDIFDKQCNIEYSIDTDLPFRRLKLELSIEVL